ncbi:MAG TPA: PEP/pyruvate-binding domain-containing protein [Patescibacteria group bacterium]|nr:PEP/pyruvate-binding domain-containing protein [Patescibacteria group bacterium]
MKLPLVIAITSIVQDDEQLVGKENVLLGKLSQSGFPVVPGFVVTKTAYKQFLNENNLPVKIKHLVGTIDVTHADSVKKTRGIIKKFIMQGIMDEAFVSELFSHYAKLEGLVKGARVIVFSPVAKPVITQGEANLILAIKEIWASYASSYPLEKHDLPVITVQHAFPPDLQGEITTDNLLITMQNGEAYTVEKTTLLMHNKTARQQTLSDETLLELAKLALQVKLITYFPQKISWIYSGEKFFITHTRETAADDIVHISSLPQFPVTATKLFTILSQSTQTKEKALLPVDGAILDGLTVEHTDTKKRAEKIMLLASPFSPRPVIYAVASSEPQAIAAELAALSYARNVLQQKHLWVLLPSVKNIADFLALEKLMQHAKLYRSASFQVLIAVDTPEVAFSLEDFLKFLIGGVVLNVPTLTKLFSGTDGASEGKGILWLIERTIQIANAHAIPIFAIGAQGTFLEKSVFLGINGIITHDAIRTKHMISEIERKLFA